MFPPNLESVKASKPFPGISAHEMEQRKLAEARVRIFANSKADVLRLLSAHDCTLGWPVVKGGK